MASGTVLTGPAMSLTVALIRSTLLKPFLQESRRACHSVKPGQGGKVTTLPPSACAGGRGGIGAQRSGLVVSLIPDPLMSLWFPCQFVLMELTAVMLLHILISCSRTVAQPSSVCWASADQETTAVCNIDSVSPVCKKRVQGNSYCFWECWEPICTYIQSNLALHCCLSSINWCRELLEVNSLWLVFSWVKKLLRRHIETPDWEAWRIPALSRLSHYTHLCGIFHRAQLSYCQPVYVKVINSN